VPLSRIVEATLDLLFPCLCGACEALLPARAAFCEGCAGWVEKLGHPRCTRCAVPFEGVGDDHPCADCLKRPPAFTTIRAPFSYGGPVAQALCRLKYGGHTELAAPLGQQLAGSVTGRFDRVVPVPLHPRRLWERGFNQAALLAAPLAQALEATLDTRSLVRRRPTAPQAGLGRRARRLNVRGAFAVRPPAREHLEGARILLVDDVVTTAETVGACARVLRRAGASEVAVAAVARAMW
jgi:ComF family protein